MVQNSIDVLKSLQSETDKIKADLDALKKLTESKEKAQKKLELYQSIQVVQELAKVQFEREKDQNVKEKIAEVQSKVSDFSKELWKLEDVVSQGKDQADQDATAMNQDNGKDKTSTQKKEEWTWASIKHFTGEQRDAVRSKETWSKEPGKNILRTAGFVATGVGAVALVYKGVKWLFGSDEEEEKEEDTKEESKSKKEKKGWFWNSWFWKALKWGGITAGSIWGISRLWNWFNGDAEPSRGASWGEKYHGYDNFYSNPENKEKAENYERIGENIDVLYSAFYQKELDAGYQDELEMQRISNEMKKSNPDAKNYKWIIPFCLDNQYGSVAAILEQNSSFKSLLGEGFAKMKNHILSWSTEKLAVLVESFFSKLPSWKLVENIEGSIVDKIKAWGEKNEEAQNELKYFFRQGIRVQTFLFEKKDQLADAIAEKKSKTLNISKKELLADSDNFEKYIAKDPDYQAFVDAPIASAMNILKKYGLDSADVSQDLKDEIQKLDQRRDELLWSQSGQSDILQVAYNKKSGEVFTADEKKNLQSACENVAKDIDEELIDAVEESVLNMYGDLFATDSSCLREYIEKSGLHEILRGSQTFLQQQKQRLANWEEIPTEELKATAQVMNDLLALKKECFLGQMTIQKDIDENWNMIYRVPGFLLGSIKNLWKSLKQVYNWEYLSGFSTFMGSLLGTGIVISAAGVLMRSNKTVILGLKTAGAPLTVPLFVLNKLMDKTAIGSRLRNKMIYGSPSWVQSNLFFRGELGQEKLLTALDNWDISLEKVERILSRKSHAPFMDVNKREEWLKIFNISKDTKREEYLAKIFDTYVTRKNGQQYLLDLRNNHRNLYDDLVKYFDHSSDIREAVRTGVSPDALQIGVDKFNKGLPVDFKGIQQLLDSPEYKGLVQRTLNSKASLSKQLEKAGSDAGKLKIKQQLDSCDEFLDMLSWKTSSEVAQIADVLDMFWPSQDAGLSVAAIKKLKTLSRLQDAVDANWNKLVSNFDDILKNLDVDELSKLLNKKVGWVLDSELDSLIKTFKTIKADGFKKAIKNADEFATCVKSLFKFAAKLS